MIFTYLCINEKVQKCFCKRYVIGLHELDLKRDITVPNIP